MEEVRARRLPFAAEVSLLLLLATLWGASYSFIKLGIATIPPITLIAARTLIAGMLLSMFMRRGVKMPKDIATWRRFAFQACLNSVIPWTLLARGERWVDAGLATIFSSATPIFTFLLTALMTRHEATNRRKLFGVIVGMAAAALVIYFRLIQTLGSVATTAQSYLRVPIGVVLSVALVGETPSPTVGIGLACVVLGAATMTIPPAAAAAQKSS